MFAIPAWIQEAGAQAADAPVEVTSSPAFDFRDPQAWIARIVDGVATYGPRILAALLILFAGRLVLRFVVSLLKRVLVQRGIDVTLVGFTANVLYIAGLVMLLITALGTAKVDTNGFVAALGAAMFAVGFALQGSLSNLAAGIMIIFFRPFRVGDTVDGGGTSGVIEEISVFSTILNTGDNRRVIVPNSAMTGGNIINYSTNPTRRVDLVFGIGYGDDLAKAKRLMKEILDADKRVLKDPAPSIGILKLGESSVELACRPWVKTSDFGPMGFDLTERIKLAFDANGISFPYPQRDVHVHNVAPTKAALPVTPSRA